MFAILSLAFAFFLAGLNRTPVPTVDGAVRASMARNIVENHQLWPITYEGKVFTDHPPLFLWLTALSYKVFGINDFAANLVPRLFAFLTVIITSMIALEVGLGWGIALLSAIILCFTRDFVLSSVRGYIEPVMEFFIYLGLWFTMHQRRKRILWPAAGAGIAVWLAAYSKGPVALWPFIYFIFLMLWNGQIARRRAQIIGIFLAAFTACTLVWAAWVEHNQHWQYWGRYVFGQVLSSALEGRGGAQHLEPFYFLSILLKFYWPWLPLLVWSCYRAGRWLLELNLSSQTSYAWTFGAFGFGFIFGFSLMKWKFWYYIAPAYPAFALFIATAMHDFVRRWLDRTAFPRRVFYLTSAWTVIVSIFPIPLHKERVQEVLDFRQTITQSPVKGPVWFVRDSADHNMIGTSGQWYFDRPVEKITYSDEEDWARNKLKQPSWIIAGSDFWPTCPAAWCAKSKLIQTSGRSVLLLFSP